MSEARLEFPPTDAVLRTLPNGLEFIVKEDHHAPVVSAQVWVRTGSILEDEHLGAGISHLLEHMVFKGSTTRGPAELAKAVQAVGGCMNACTSFDRTVYYVDAPVEGAETALDVLTDLTVRAIFPEEEFEKEKDVIRREIDMGEDDPDTKHSHLLFSTVFRRHPMGQPVIGHLDLFNRITRDQMRAYYEQHYVPGNMFVIVAGAVTPDQVQAWLEPRFGHLPRARVPHVFVPAEPDQLGRREAHIEFTTELSKLTLAWRVPGLTHPDVPALDVLATILGHGRSSRLFRRIREELGLAHSIGAGCYTPAEGGVFSIHGELDAHQRDAVRTEAMAMVEEIQSRGVSVGEIRKAQKMILSQQLGSLTSASGLAADLGSNWHVARNLDYTREVVQAIERVTPSQVQDVARKYLVERCLTITSLNPHGTLDESSASAARSERAGIQRTVRPDGLTVLVKEDRRIPAVTLHATLRGGVLSETPATAGLTRLMARSLLKGTTTRSASDVALTLEEAGGSIHADTGGSTFALTIEVLKPDLAMGLELLADVLLRPAFPEAEVARERELQTASIRAEQDRLTSVAFQELRQGLFGHHPFSQERNGTVDSLAGLTPADLRDFHQRHVVTGNAVISVFGDVDASTVTALVEKHFAGMTAGNRVQPEFTLAPPPPVTAATRVAKRDKKQAVLAVGFPTVDIRHADRLALDLLDEACSDMASRIFLRIREDQGLAYSTGAVQILGMAPGAFAFYLGTSPDLLEKARTELLDEIAKLGRDGLDPAEYARARATWTGKHLLGMQSPDALARTTALDELYGFGCDYHESLHQRLDATTLDQVNAAARRYFHEQPAIIVEVVPG